MKISDSHELVADETRLILYGVVQLPVSPENVKTKDVFVVIQISKNDILRLTFLVAY